MLDLWSAAAGAVRAVVLSGAGASARSRAGAYPVALMALHYQFPFQLGSGQTSFATCEEGSDQEIAASLATVSTFEIGSWPGDETLGVPDDLFEQGGVDISAFVAAVIAQESRADLLMTDQSVVDELAAGLRVYQLGFTPVAT